MLKKVELYEVQDKVRLMSELNELVDEVNATIEAVKDLSGIFEAHLKSHHEHEDVPPHEEPEPTTKKKK